VREALHLGEFSGWMLGVAAGFGAIPVFLIQFGERVFFLVKSEE